ncbi:MAG TPA: DUF4124 domain-containing protein [Burkholderiales bacterium]|nr:DUF4124 domain-containing protein [Burkholderiales bacterium]
MRSAMLLAVMCCAAGLALAEEPKKKPGIYKCIGADGSVTYSSEPCKGKSKTFLSDKDLKKKASTVRGGGRQTVYPAGTGTAEAPPASDEADSKQVKQPAALVNPVTGTIINEQGIK